MIYKWNDISVRTFKEIFDNFWNSDTDLVKSKVIEISNIPHLINYNHDVRIFFGKKISLDDWEEYNKDSLDFLKKELENTRPDYLDFIKNNSKLSMCVTENVPRITPLGSVTEHYGLVMRMLFGTKTLNEKFDSLTPMNLCFTRNSDNKIVPNFDEDPSKDADRFVRVRGIDYETWFEEMKYFEKHNRFSHEFIKDDLIQLNFKLP